ncbi:hypothetical protein V6N13_094694 [Hibiscus sabdariffa]|uniref:Uncharacterized protein n=1 Tax=Hibiscus sabdariffa TaxID=183260 RepID=A0ABR2A7S9_9ROSI
MAAPCNHLLHKLGATVPCVLHTSRLYLLSRSVFGYSETFLANLLWQLGHWCCSSYACCSCKEFVVRIPSLFLYCLFGIPFLLPTSPSFSCLTGCVSGYGLFCEKQKPLENRKMLLQADLKVNNGSSTGAGYWGNFRTVPSGPDPLHHNGGSPKKPKTDP